MKGDGWWYQSCTWGDSQEEQGQEGGISPGLCPVGHASLACLACRGRRQPKEQEQQKNKGSRKRGMEGGEVCGGRWRDGEGTLQHALHEIMHGACIIMQNAVESTCVRGGRGRMLRLVMNRCGYSSSENEFVCMHA